MKSWKSILWALPVLFVTCGGNQPDPEPVKLVANPAELEFGPEGGTQNITITSGIQPAVSSLDDWVVITSGTPSGHNYPYSVQVSPYNGTLDHATKSASSGTSRA